MGQLVKAADVASGQPLLNTILQIRTEVDEVTDGIAGLATRYNEFHTSLNGDAETTVRPAATQFDLVTSISSAQAAASTPPEP